MPSTLARLSEKPRRYKGDAVENVEVDQGGASAEREVNRRSRIVENARLTRDFQPKHVIRLLAPAL